MSTALRTTTQTPSAAAATDAVTTRGLVEITKVRKSFGAAEVLKGITLTVEPGGVAVIVGPSGSGKSTLLRTINHLEKVDAGFIAIDGTLAGCDVVDVESDAAAMSVAIGASGAGARTYTVTAGQGLLSMAAAVFDAAGLGLPIVMTVGDCANNPPTNTWNDHTDSMSMREFAAGHFITSELLTYFESHYLRPANERDHPDVSPLNADLRGLPPAFVQTAECDPLRDQGEAYAEKLEQAGVPVRLKRYEGMIHPFFSLAGIIDGGKAAIADAAAALRDAAAQERV